MGLRQKIAVELCGTQIINHSATTRYDKKPLWNFVERIIYDNWHAVCMALPSFFSVSSTCSAMRIR